MGGFGPPMFHRRCPTGFQLSFWPEFRGPPLQVPLRFQPLKYELQKNLPWETKAGYGNLDLNLRLKHAYGVLGAQEH